MRNGLVSNAETRAPFIQKEFLSLLVTPTPSPVFGLEAVTEEAGLGSIIYRPNTFGDGAYGASFGDVNGDSFIDLVVHASGPN